MNRNDLTTLATLRLSEARALLAAGHRSGAYYLAGYAIECALKAVIAGQTEQYEFPDKQRALDSFIHDLPKLCKTAKLESEFRSALQANLRFRDHWEYVIRWTENSRYLFREEFAARAMVVAVGNEKDGVLPWIMKYW